MNSSSKTNWERLDALTDADIDTSDSPPLTDEFFAQARWLLPGQTSSSHVALDEAPVHIELDLDRSVFAWFQAQGADCEPRMRAALRLYAEAHQQAA